MVQTPSGMPIVGMGTQTRHDDNMYRDSDRRKSEAEALADRLAERVRAKGFVKRNGEPNISAAADYADVGYATMHDLLSGSAHNPKRSTLEKIAARFGVTVDWLLHGDVEQAGSFEQGAEFVIRALRAALDDVERKLAERSTPREGPPTEQERAKARAGLRAKRRASASREDSKPKPADSDG